MKQAAACCHTRTDRGRRERGGGRATGRDPRKRANSYHLQSASCHRMMLGAAACQNWGRAAGVRPRPRRVGKPARYWMVWYRALAPVRNAETQFALGNTKGARSACFLPQCIIYQPSSMVRTAGNRWTRVDHAPSQGAQCGYPCQPGSGSDRIGSRSAAALTVSHQRPHHRLVRCEKSADNSGCPTIGGFSPEQVPWLV